jgi:hypothetical protein
MSVGNLQQSNMLCLCVLLHSRTTMHNTSPITHATQAIRSVLQSMITLQQVGEQVDDQTLNNECIEKIQMWKDINLVLDNPYNYQVRIICDG